MKYLSNYPDGAENDPRAPWNQVDEDDEPRWFTFHKAIVSIKAGSKEEAMDKLNALFPRNNPNIECDYAPEEVEDMG